MGKSVFLGFAFSISLLCTLKYSVSPIFGVWFRYSTFLSACTSWLPTKTVVSIETLALESLDLHVCDG